MQQGSNFLGVGYAAIPDVFFAVFIHMAWTILPTGLVVGIGAHRRLNDWRTQRRSMRRQEQGLCGVCGYDLRQSQGRCPECGNIVPDERAGKSGALKRSL